MDTGDRTGKFIAHYRVLCPVSEGGMGVIYQAADPHLDRIVAIKVIKMQPGGLAQEFVRRFEREAHMLARLQHPNIVPIIDYGVLEDHSPYLVMPFLSGGSLSNRAGRPIYYRDAARLLAPVAEALAYAHRAGIIHRDIKPSNILFTASGDPMLADFGIAKPYQDDSGLQSSLRTVTGLALGTPGYMAPEQWNGVALPQTDVFALGMVFYELVTGINPYAADTPQAALMRQVTEPLPLPSRYVSGLPAEVEAVLLRALDKDPLHRYPTMESFGQALHALAAGSPPPFPRNGATLSVARPGSQPSVRQLPMSIPATSSPRAFPASSKPGLTASNMPGPPAAGLVRQHPWRPWAAALGVLGLGFVVMLLIILPKIIALWEGAFTPGSAPRASALPAVYATTRPLTITMATAVVVTPSLSEPEIGPQPALVGPTLAPSLIATRQVIGLQPAPSTSQAKETLPPTAIPANPSVLWDSSHGPDYSQDKLFYDPSGLYANLSGLLAQNSFVLKNNTQELAQVPLAQFGVVVVCDWSAYKETYSIDDARLLSDYVRQGGSILILAEKPEPSLRSAKTIASEFSIQAGLAPALKSAVPVADHPLTQGVSQVLFLFSGGTLHASEDALVIAASGANPAVVARDGLPGRVVVIGDANLFDNRGLGQADNTRFALNVFRWLTHQE